MQHSQRWCEIWPWGLRTHKPRPDGQIRTPRHGDPTLLRQRAVQTWCLVPCGASRTETPTYELTLHRDSVRLRHLRTPAHPTPAPWSPGGWGISAGMSRTEPLTVTAHRLQRAVKPLKRGSEGITGCLSTFTSFLTRRNSSHQQRFYNSVWCSLFARIFAAERCFTEMQMCQVAP